MHVSNSAEFSWLSHMLCFTASQTLRQQPIPFSERMLSIIICPFCRNRWLLLQQMLPTQETIHCYLFYHMIAIFRKKKKQRGTLLPFCSLLGWVVDWSCITNFYWQCDAQFCKVNLYNIIFAFAELFWFFPFVSKNAHEIKF